MGVHLNVMNSQSADAGPPRQLAGSCYCGAVRYEVADEFEYARQNETRSGWLIDVGDRDRCGGGAALNGGGGAGDRSFLCEPLDRRAVGDGIAVFVSNRCRDCDLLIREYDAHSNVN